MKKLFTLCAVVLFFVLASNAQPGNTCPNAINLPALPVNILDSAAIQTTKWYSFVPGSNNIFINIQDVNLNGAKVKSMVLYDNCGGLVIDSISVNNPSQDSLYMTSSHLHHNHRYYMAVNMDTCLACHISPHEVQYVLRIGDVIENSYKFQPAYTFSKCGLNYALASVATHERSQPTCSYSPSGCAQITHGPYYLNIAGIPPGATITAAYLLWGVIGVDYSQPNWLSNQTFTLLPPAINNNAPLNGSATVSLQAPNFSIQPPYATCWADDKADYHGIDDTHEFLSDIKGYIGGLKQPNGRYEIRGLPYYNPSNNSFEDPDADGATLIIVYEDPCADYTGYFSMTGGFDVVNNPTGIYQYSLIPFAGPSNPAKGSAFLIAGDIQSCTYDSWLINGTSALFDGSTPPPIVMNPPAAIWNTVQVNTSYFTGQNFVPFNIDNTPANGCVGDCFDMFAMGAYYQVPNKHNSICNSLSISPQNPYICANTPDGGASLTVTDNYASDPVPGINYVWSPAAGLSSTTGAMVVATPSVTTTYTVQAYDANGDKIPCLTATVTVNVANITITGDQAVCSEPCDGCSKTNKSPNNYGPGYNLTFTTTESGFPCNNYTYAWSNSTTNAGVIVSGLNTNTYSVFIPEGDVVDFNNGFTVSVTVCCNDKNSSFCCTQTFQVYGCCKHDQCPQLVSPDFLMNPTPSQLRAMKLSYAIDVGPNNGPMPDKGGYNHLGYPGFNYVVDSVNGSGQPTWYIEDICTSTDGCALFIDGVVQVNANLVIRNSDILMGPEAKFVLAPGVTMTVENSHIHACEAKMWVGIFVPHTAKVLVNNGSLIEDAEEAIVSENGGTYTINNSTLNKNHIGIYVEPYNGTHPGTITLSQIACNTISSNVPPFNGLADVTLNTPDIVTNPYGGQRTSMGMLIDSVRTITVGAAGLPNTFENLDYGINSNATNINVVNNTFNDIVPANAASPGIYGVYAKGDATRKINVNVGVSGSNTFENWSIGAFLRDSINGNVLNNTIKNCQEGIATVNNFGNILKLNNNNITGVGVIGVNAYNNFYCQVQVNNNTITGGFANIGVYINEITIYPFTSYIVDNNRMSNVGNGILCTNLYAADILNNVITLNNSRYVLNTGIYAAGSLLSTVYNNNIADLHLMKNSEYGIYVNYGSGANRVFCNNTAYTDNGIAFAGPSVSTGMIENVMAFNKNGLLLFPSTVIGAQGAVGAPNDNQWLNCANSTNAQPPATSFFVQSSILYDPGNNLGGGITFIPTFGTSPCNCATGNGCFGSGIGSGTAAQVINDSTSFVTYPASSHWIEKHSLFKYLTAIDSSLLSDTLVKNFRDSVVLANMGKLETVAAYLADSNGITPYDIATASSLNNSLVSPDAIEQTAQSVNNVAISMQSAGRNFPNAMEISTLKTIALLCPAQYGNAVFVARAMLSQVDSAVYISSCEQILDSADNHRPRKIKNGEGFDSLITAKVYPNPANSILTIEVALNKGEIAYLELYNSLGQRVEYAELQNKLTTLNVSKLAVGIYYYRLLDNNKHVILADKVAVMQ